MLECRQMNLIHPKTPLLRPPERAAAFPSARLARPRPPRCLEKRRPTTSMTVRRRVIVRDGKTLRWVTPTIAHPRCRRFPRPAATHPVLPPAKTATPAADSQNKALACSERDAQRPLEAIKCTPRRHGHQTQWKMAPRAFLAVSGPSLSAPGLAMAASRPNATLLTRPIGGGHPRFAGSVWPPRPARPGDETINQGTPSGLDPKASGSSHRARTARGCHGAA